MLDSVLSGNSNSTEARQCAQTDAASDFTHRGALKFSAVSDAQPLISSPTRPCSSAFAAAATTVDADSPR